MPASGNSIFPYWEESETEQTSDGRKMVIAPFHFNTQEIVPSPTRAQLVRSALAPSDTPVVLEVTYTKQLTQRYKRCSDGLLTVYPLHSMAKLENTEGGFLASCDMNSVVSLIDRWNKAAIEGTGLEIAKGFGKYLVYVSQANSLLSHQGWSEIENNWNNKSYLEAEIDKLQSQVDKYLHLHKSAIIIQQFYKSRFSITQLPQRIKAAKFIQHYFRLHLAYVKSKPIPDLDRLAASIQHAYRQYRFRKLVLHSGLFVRTARVFASLALKRSLRCAYTCGHRWRLLTQARKEQRLARLRLASAKRIQRVFRLFRAHRKRKEAIALQVQLRWRMRLSKRKVEDERRKQLELRILLAMRRKDWSDERYRDLVIRRLQSHWREIVLKRRVQDFRQKHAAALIQKSLRKRKAIEVELLHNAAARKLQATFKALAVKRNYDHTRMMVMKVQAKWRRFIASRRVKFLASEAREMRQLELEANVIRALIDRDKAVYLELLVRQCQAVWRGKVARRRLMAEQLIRDKNDAVLRILAVQESAEFKNILRASIKIQSFAKAKEVRGQFLALKLLVTRIQARWRGVVVRRKVARMKEELGRLEQVAIESEVIRAMLSRDKSLYKEMLVRQMQALWRAKVQKRKIDVSLQTGAVLKIQAVWRGKNGRREAEIIRQQELMHRYHGVRQVDLNLGYAAKRQFDESPKLGMIQSGKDGADVVLVLPDDLAGLIHLGKFITGPLKGLFLSDLPAGALAAEEIEIYRTMVEEEIVDVDKAAQTIQTAWRLFRRGGKKGTEMAVTKWFVRSRARLMTVMQASVAQNIIVDETAMYDRKFVLIEGERIEYIQDRSPSFSPGYGVVVCGTPLKMIKETENLECLYFSVTVTELFAGRFGDGLTLGFTETFVAEQSVVPETADGLSGGLTVLVGFDGHAYSSSLGEFYEIDFNPRNLKVGDKVGCMLVYPAGDLVYLVNDEIVGVAEISITRKEHLYPVIDLMGSVKAVKLTKSDKPPVITAEEPEPTQSEQTPFGMLQGAMASAVLAAQNVALFNDPPKPEKKKETISSWIAFDSDYVDSDVVRVSDDALVAEYVGLKFPVERYKARGVLVTDRPIPKQGNLLFFQLTLLEQVRGFPDGITMGFCGGIKGHSPKADDFPDTADGIPGDVWLAGFDGQWFSNRIGWGQLGWTGNNLREGDRVGFVGVFPAGDLLILVNDEIVAEAPLQIPSGRQLFGVVDLLGATNAVRLDLDATPPKIELNDN